MPNLPKRNGYVEYYKNLHCRITSDNTILISIMNKVDDDLTDLYKILFKYPKANVVIKNINSLKELNSLCRILGTCQYDGNVTIDLLSRITRNHSLEGLVNNMYIDLEDLPSFVKINGFYKNSTQTDFSIWAHNLNVEDKTTLLRCLTDEDKKLFMEQEKVIDSFYNEFIEACPEALTLSEKERFEKVFMYIFINFPYSFEALGSDGDVKLDCYHTKDALETYKNRRGVCGGRANLLTLVTNNPKLCCNSATISGNTEPSSTYPNGQSHAWNVFIDNDGKAYHYDLSFKSFCRRDLLDIGERRIDEIYNSNVKKIFDSIPPELPPRTRNYRPLPPRREE